ncbi:hypothetical protein Tco_1421293, partial [Tanacetum coccineum]
KKQQQDTESSRKNEDKGKEKVINVEEDAEQKRKIKGKGKEKVVDVEEDVERKRKVKVKRKEKLVDSEEGSGKNKRINKQKHNNVLKGGATVRQLFEAMRGLSPERKKLEKEWNVLILEQLIKKEEVKKEGGTTWKVEENKCGCIDNVLGLPMGRRRLKREGHIEYNDPFLLQWKDQFRDVNKLTIKALSDLTYLHYTKFDMLKVKRRLLAFKSWNTSLLKKREIAELQNDYMVIGEIQDDVGEGEEPNQKEELYEMLEENINNILIEKSEIEEKINESLIKFQDDEKLLQLKQWMKDIFKEPDMPEYLSSSSSESDDNNDDGSQLADENEESYRKETHSNDKDNVEIIAEVQKDERNETHYTAECSEKKDKANNNKEEGMENTKAKNQKIVKVQKEGRNENQNIVECSEKKDEQETGTSKKEEADNNKEEGMPNKKATNQKINEEIDPFDDPKFGEYYIQNEHLFVPTQTSAEKKKDQTDDVNWDSFLEKEEEIIRKGREFSDEIRKKAQQQELERKRKGKKEKDQIGSSSQKSHVFSIDNSLQGSQPTFDLGASPTYEKMKILSEQDGGPSR